MGLNRIVVVISFALAAMPMADAQEVGWPSPPFKRATVDGSSCAQPAYPAASIAANEEGKVLLMFHVDAKGAVLRERVARSSGHARLDEAALEALRQCRFLPFKGPDGPVESVARVEYVWRIVDSPRTMAVAASTATGCAPERLTAPSGEAPQLASRLVLTLTRDGWVEHARVERGSGNPRLDALALSTYATCRFRPPPSNEGDEVRGVVTVDHAWR